MPGIKPASFKIFSDVGGHRHTPLVAHPAWPDSGNDQGWQSTRKAACAQELRDPFILTLFGRVIHRPAAAATLTRSWKLLFNDGFSAIFNATFTHLSGRQADRSCHETHLPTFRSPTQAYPRFSGPHENQGRPRRHSCPSRQGAQASRGLRQLGDAARKAAGSRGLGSADFTALFKSPKRARSRHFSLFWRCADNAALGMVVSKKLAGNAIRRNLVKRHAREAFRACLSDSGQTGGSALEVVIRVSADIRALPRNEQFAEISSLFAKCSRRE